MTEVTYIHGVIEKAKEMGLPQESILAAQSFAAFPESSWRDVIDIDLGNGYRFTMKIQSLPGGERTLVSVLGCGAWVFHHSGGALHWGPVKNLLGIKYTCNAVALTCLLGIALQRPVAVDGACDCPVHRSK